MLNKFVFMTSDFVLKVGTRLIRGSVVLMRLVSRRRPTNPAATRIWIDVGAHRGETTFEHARKSRDLLVYAFEPDVSVASHRYSILNNFILLPMAVTEVDGFREFHINSNDRTSSLLPLADAGLQAWRGVDGLRTVRKAIVPTVRLDTFMEALGIAKVEYLKIDAQGHDLEVVRSLGERINDVAQIRLEACAIENSLYDGAHNKIDEVVRFMRSKGFGLVENHSESMGQERNLVFRPSKCPVAAESLVEERE